AGERREVFRLNSVNALEWWSDWSDPLWRFRKPITPSLHQSITPADTNMTTDDEIRFVDTTIRDGHQSLWAENMTTGMMLPVAEAMDRAGFDAIELISSSPLE